MNQNREKQLNLRSFLKTLWNEKFFITILVFSITIISVIYVYFKNPIPIYSGSMMVEIGEIKSSNRNHRYFDNAYALKNILEREYKISVKLPKKANNTTPNNNIITLIVEDMNKKKIKDKMNAIYAYILDRHKVKIKLYDKYIMTRQVGPIIISKTAINEPKKKIIVILSFVTSILLAVFLVYFIQVIKDFRKEEVKKNVI